MSNERCRCCSCGGTFGGEGSGREPRVLPCGDSYCLFCINQQFRMTDAFNCCRCTQLVERDMKLPLNKLYYEMLAQWKQIEARREWEHPPLTPPEIPNHKLVKKPIDKRCLNPFCTREPYQQQNFTDLFCSKRCFEEHEQFSQSSENL